MSIRQAHSVFIACVVVLFAFTARAGTAHVPGDDSLQQAWKRAAHDTERIRLRYIAAKKQNILRPAYWDSLQKEAAQHSMYLYECLALTGKGRAYRVANDRAKAQLALNQAFQLAGNRGYKQVMLSVLKELMVLYKHKTDGRQLLDVSYKGLKLAEALGDTRTAIDFYSTIGVHYFFLEDFDKALEMDRLALKKCLEINYAVGIVGALTDIGTVYCHLANKGHPENNDSAVKYYLASKRYIPELGETSYRAYVFHCLTTAYSMLGRFDSAAVYGDKAYALCRKLNNQQGMASSLLAIGSSLIAQNRLNEAERTVLEGLKQTKASGFGLQMPQVWRCLSDIYERKHDYKKALDYYRLFMLTRDSITSQTNKELAKQKEIDYQVEKKESENKLLAQQNQIQSLQLAQSKYLMIALVAVVVALLLFGYLLFRQSRLAAEQQKVMLQQKLLRSQMNPHFIFNSLNSIQQLIVSNNNDRAETYLLKFSRLVRDLLESNIKENITVREEAGILRGYIELEALRFKQSFSASVTVSDRVPDNATIPHMMVQPFVENAIWHGLLLKKEGQRSLSVAFEPGPGRTVLCTVDDNGIGRRANLNRKNTFKRQSLALSFIHQRLGLIRKTMKIDCSVTITDKVNEQGEALGTKVLLVLPLLEPPKS